MSKWKKLLSGLLASFLCLALLHVWLNIGFDKLGLGWTDDEKNTFRVGFLPVT